MDVTPDAVHAARSHRAFVACGAAVGLVAESSPAASALITGSG